MRSYNRFVHRGAWLALLVALQPNLPAAIPNPSDNVPATFDSLGPSAPLAGAHLSQRALLARLAKDETFAPSREAFLEGARRIRDLPVITRPRTLAELKRQRLPWDARYEQNETFALASSDTKATSRLADELPALAAAWRLTGDASFLRRTLDQLEEMADWSPMQRPGWTLMSRPDLPPGGDGAWLATGRGVRAITDALALLDEDEVSADLRARLKTLLAAEIKSVADDWATARPWYVKERAAYSNQWILPTEGLLRACVYLGREKFPDAYELGVANLLASLDIQGKRGEFVEGLYYSTESIGSMLSAAQAMREAGDERAIRHPYLAHYPVWLAHHIQPGGFLINAFDTMGTRGDVVRYADTFAALAVTMESPEALWVVRTRSGFGDTLQGLLARALPADRAAPPPLHAYYPVATRVNWRDSWDDATAAGLWIRGGHRSDFHDHMDRGHVNFVVGNRAILIEAGKPGNADPRLYAYFRTVAGHNVLQVGDPDLSTLSKENPPPNPGQIWDAEHRTAPLTIKRLDITGGEAVVDAGACYRGVEKWIRRVTWTRREVEIRDEVILPAPDIVLFRWHLGLDPAERAALGAGRLEADDFTVSYEADQPLAPRIDIMPDMTLKASDSHHPCLVLRSTDPVRALTLTTRITLPNTGG